jgi:hypothetical protein
MSVTRKYIEELGISPGDRVRLTVVSPWNSEQKVEAVYKKVIDGNGCGDILGYVIPQKNVSMFSQNKEIYFQRPCTEVLDIRKL